MAGVIVAVGAVLEGWTLKASCEASPNIESSEFGHEVLGQVVFGMLFYKVLRNQSHEMP